MFHTNGALEIRPFVLLFLGGFAREFYRQSVPSFYFMHISEILSTLSSNALYNHIVSRWSVFPTMQESRHENETSKRLFFCEIFSFELSVLLIFRNNPDSDCEIFWQ